jgi:integrase
MSVYFKQGHGWRYDFTLNRVRHTNAWFKTKAKAKEAEAKRKEALNKPTQLTPKNMAFLELINRRLDYVKAYCSERHYRDYIYLSRRWINEWGSLQCSEITTDAVQAYLIKRSRVSPDTANKDLRSLRATFNFGIKWYYLSVNPTARMVFMPTEKRIKYVPSKEDIEKVLIAADADTRDYLYTIKETMGRMSEINQLLWSDVDLEKRYVVLYTRKKKGGHRTPRKVPMTENLYKILTNRYKNRDEDKPWVFWHRYWDRRQRFWAVAPYIDRKTIMKSLCKKAGVRYFRFHALRHYGASMLDNANVNIGSIQRLLGHENRKTTEIYLHSIGDSERQAMKIFEQVTKKSHIESHTLLH